MEALCNFIWSELRIAALKNQFRLRVEDIVAAILWLAQENEFLIF